MTNRMWVLHFFFDILSHFMTNSMWVTLLFVWPESPMHFIPLFADGEGSLKCSLITSDTCDQQRVSVTASFSFPGFMCCDQQGVSDIAFFLFHAIMYTYHISWLAGCESQFYYQDPYSLSAHNQQTVSDTTYLHRTGSSHICIHVHTYLPITNRQSVTFHLLFPGTTHPQTDRRYVNNTSPLFATKSTHISSHDQQEVSRAALLSQILSSGSWPTESQLYFLLKCITTFSTTHVPQDVCGAAIILQGCHLLLTNNRE